MEEEDLEPRTLRPKPLDLGTLSIEALSDYIGELEGEIERVRAAISVKGRKLRMLPSSRRKGRESSESK